LLYLSEFFGKAMYMPKTIESCVKVDKTLEN